MSTSGQRDDCAQCSAPQHRHDRVRQIGS